MAALLLVAFLTGVLATQARAQLTPAAAPVFSSTAVYSPAGGTYATAQSVTITDATPGALIYYTVDGTAPTTSSALYTGAIAVAATQTIRAVAMAPGYAQSAVAAATYNIILSELAGSVPIIADDDSPTVGAPIWLSTWSFATPYNVTEFVPGNSELFRTPLGPLIQTGANGPDVTLWNSGLGTPYGFDSCYNGSATKADGEDYYVDFIYNNQYFYIYTSIQEGAFTLEVDGQWATQYFDYKMSSSIFPPGLYLIPVTFNSARPRRIRLLMTPGFAFGGILTEGGPGDITAPTSTNFPTNPVLIVASDSTGQTVVEQGRMSWPLRLGMAIDAPVHNASCGGTSFSSGGTSTPNVTLAALVKRYPNDICSFISALGQSSGIILYGLGINATSAPAAEGAAAGTVFAGVASCAPGWIQDYVGPWSPSSSPLVSGLQATQTAVMAAAASSGVYESSNPIAEKWITGAEPNGRNCPPDPLPSDADGSACYYIDALNPPHPWQQGADHWAWRTLQDLTSTGLLIPNALTYSPASTTNVAWADPVCDLKQGGTISVNGASITGNGTAFTKCLMPGFTIYTLSGGIAGTISAIESDTAATLTRWTGVGTNMQYMLSAPQLADVPEVSLSTATVAFGNQNLASESATLTVTLTNSGTGTLSLGGVTLAGANASSFTMSTNCGGTLAANASCTIVLQFDPQVAGAATATVSVSDNAFGSPHSINLGGTGVGVSMVSLSPSSVAFGAVTVGNVSAEQTVTLTNTGTANLSFGGVTLTDPAAQFRMSNLSCNGQLAVNESCTIRLLFYPSASGAANATVSFADNAIGSPQVVTLSGAGSNPLPVPLPLLLSSDSATAGGDGFTLVVSRANFTPASVVLWNGAVRTTTFLSSTQLAATILSSDIATEGTQLVTVANAAPNASLSAAQPFVVMASKPVVIIHVAALASTDDTGESYVLTIAGSNMLEGSVIEWGATPLATSYVSPWELSAVVPAAQYASRPVHIQIAVPAGAVSTPFLLP